MPTKSSKIVTMDIINVVCIEIIEEEKEMFPPILLVRFRVRGLLLHLYFRHLFLIHPRQVYDFVQIHLFGKNRDFCVNKFLLDLKETQSPGVKYSQTPH